MQTQKSVLLLSALFLFLCQLGSAAPALSQESNARVLVTEVMSRHLAASYDLPRLEPRLLSRDIAMPPKADTPRPPALAILCLIGPVSRGHDADPETFDFVVPNKVILRHRRQGFNATLGQFRHIISPVLPLIRGSTMEHCGV